WLDHQVISSAGSTCDQSISACSSSPASAVVAGPEHAAASAVALRRARPAMNCFLRGVGRAVILFIMRFLRHSLSWPCTSRGEGAPSGVLVCGAGAGYYPVTAPA